MGGNLSLERLQLCWSGEIFWRPAQRMLTTSKSVCPTFGHMAHQPVLFATSAAFNLQSSCVCGDTAPRDSKRNQTPLNSDSRIKCSEINDPVIFHLSCDFTTSIWYTAGQLVATATAAAAVALSAVFSAFTPATHIHQELVRDPIVPIPAHSLRPFIVEKVWAPISYMCPSCSSWTHHMNHRICNAHMRFGVLHMPCMVFHILFLIYKYICCSLLSFVFLSLSVLEVHQCNPYKWFIIEIVMLVECAKQQREK